MDSDLGLESIEIHSDQNKVFLALVLSLLFVSAGLYAVTGANINSIRYITILFGVVLFFGLAFVCIRVILIGATVLCKISKTAIWLKGKSGDLLIPWADILSISRVTYARQWGQNGMLLKMTPESLSKLTANKNLSGFRKINEGIIINTALFNRRFDELERIMLDCLSTRNAK